VKERIGRPSSLDSISGPQIRRGYPPNLSISFSGGKETKEDSPSNGERTGISLNRPGHRAGSWGHSLDFGPESHKDRIQPKPPGTAHRSG